MARDYYDIRISRDTLGEATEEDVTRYCGAAEIALAVDLDADVRVRVGDGTESYTWIGADGSTGQAPLTEQMRDALTEVYEDAERWVA